MDISVNEVLDCKGLSCPMPIVKTKKAIQGLNEGQILEVQATDKGSTADLKAWAESTGHQYIGTTEDDSVLKHYLRKSKSSELKTEQKHPNKISNEEFSIKLNNNIQIIDVREPAEYAFGHIPNSVSIPFGELENRIDELDKEKETYVICQTGSRSDLASQKLSAKGFSNVINVVPGMSKWKFTTNKNK